MPPRVSRRRAVLAAGTAVAAALGAVLRPPAAGAVTAHPRDLNGDPLMGVDVREYGAERGGTIDCTAAFQRAVNAASSSYGRVLVPNGTWLVNGITVPKLVKIVGLGADISYYASSTTRSGGANLVRDPAVATPMLTVNGHGVSIENLTLLGKGGSAPLLVVQNGFESRFDRLRLHGVTGTALHVEQLNNNSWTDVFINDCGSASQAAMRIRSPRAATNSNTLTFTNLTIEGSANTALDIGWGSTAQDFVEFVRFIAPHFEAEQRDGTNPLVRIGNVRSVEFHDALIYGGPGPLVRHEEQFGRGAVLRGGVRFIGGTLLGMNGKVGRPSGVLVDLVAGDDTALLGTRLGQFTEAGIRIGAAYGPRVHAGADVSAEGYDSRGAAASRPLLDDRR
ncbi:MULTISPECIES: glycosyl hydrolase family 28-related protein [Curtobacterium]|uniref:glycosyl hydrolase family 28-related protein n=1 Tax=Curtobacterium flaccumfaciens TaxID=2035 RepID=UPI003EE5FC76